MSPVYPIVSKLGDAFNIRRRSAGKNKKTAVFSGMAKRRSIVRPENAAAEVVCS